MGAYFRIYRDCDTFRLRKWVIEFWLGEELLDRRRSFGGWGFFRRCMRKMNRMVKMRDMALAAMIRQEENR